MPDLYIVEIHRTGYVPILAESGAEAREKAERNPCEATWEKSVQAVSARMEFAIDGGGPL